MKKKSYHQIYEQSERLTKDFPITNKWGLKALEIAMKYQSNIEDKFRYSGMYRFQWTNELVNVEEYSKPRELDESQKKVLRISAGI